MKICVLSFTGLDTDGRDATRILKEMRSLVLAGHEVKAVGLRLRKDILQKEQYYGVEINRIKPALSFQRKLQREIPNPSLFSKLKWLYTLTIKNTLASGLTLFKVAWRENADVYHCFGIYSLVPGFFLKMLKRKKVIYDAYEVPHQSINTLSSLGSFAKPLSKVVGHIELLLASRMDYILTIPSAGDEYFGRFKRWNRNVEFLRNTPSSDWNSVSAPGLINEYRGQKIMLYMGAFTKAKGIFKILEVFNIVHRDYPTAKLVLAGSFDETKAFDNAKEEAIGYIQSCNLQDCVVVTGHIPWQEIPGYLNVADIAMYINEPNPVQLASQGSSKFFEYLAASLPIIASDFPGIGSIVKKYNCGIVVDPSNKREIADAALRLLNSPDLAHEMGKNAREAFDKEFNWELEEEKLLQVYSGLERKIRK